MGTPADELQIYALRSGLVPPCSLTRDEDCQSLQKITEELFFGRGKKGVQKSQHQI